MLFVTLLDYLYWVLSATLGGLAGSLLRFDTNGIGFVMTAMFTAIFIDRWKKEKNHLSVIAGVAVPAVCLIIFGADSFMLPSMAAIILLLAAAKKRLCRSEDKEK